MKRVPPFTPRLEIHNRYSPTKETVAVSNVCCSIGTLLFSMSSRPRMTFAFDKLWFGQGFGVAPVDDGSVGKTLKPLDYSLPVQTQRNHGVSDDPMADYHLSLTKSVLWSWQFQKPIGTMPVVGIGCYGIIRAVVYVLCKCNRLCVFMQPYTHSSP